VNPSIQRFFDSSSFGEAEVNTTRTEQTTSEPQQQSASQTVAGYQQETPRVPSLEHRVSLNQVTTFPWSLTQDLDEYKRAQIAGIGLNWRKLSEFGVRHAMRRILETGLPVSSLGCLGGFTGENGYSAKDVLADSKRMIRVAGQLKADTVTVVTGAQGGHIRSNANRLVVEALKQLVPFAALYGVQLALQPMHAMFARSWSFVHSLDETLQILDRVRDSRLKLSFGTYHLWQEPGLMQRLEELTPRIGIVRLADWGDAPRHDHDRLLPGEGRLPLPGMVRTLEEAGYSGWYEIEVWSRDLWKQDRRDLMQSCLLSRDHLASCQSIV